MSIILKGIDMPKTGERVYAEIRPSGEVEYIAVTYGKDYTRSAKVERTNAIQIPKGHGRLIDADALVTVFKEDAKCEWNQKVSPISWAYAFEDTIDEIQNAPTILEAEEE